MTTRRLFGLVIALLVSTSASVIWYLDALEGIYVRPAVETVDRPAPAGGVPGAELLLSDTRPRRRHLRLPSSTGGELHVRLDDAAGAILGASEVVLTDRAAVEAPKAGCWDRVEAEPAEG